MLLHNEKHKHGKLQRCINIRDEHYRALQQAAETMNGLVSKCNPEFNQRDFRERVSIGNIIEMMVEDRYSHLLETYLQNNARTFEKLLAYQKKEKTNV